MTVLTAGLVVREKLCAQAQAILVRADDVGQWPLPSSQVHEPKNFPLYGREQSLGRFTACLLRNLMRQAGDEGHGTAVEPLGTR